MNINHLYHPNGIYDLHQLFLKYLKNNSISLYNQYIEYVNSTEFNNHILELQIAEYIESFITEYFDIQKHKDYIKSTIQWQDIINCRKSFINKFVKPFDVKKVQHKQHDTLLTNLLKNLNSHKFNAHNFSTQVLQEITQGTVESPLFISAIEYGSYYINCYNKSLPEQDLIFFKPKKLDINQLVSYKTNTKDTYEYINNDISINREDFNLYHYDLSHKNSLHNSSYCIKCKDRKRDYCSIGYQKKEEITSNELGKKLIGCPLNMHISQMHSMNEAGKIIAAMAFITINNPLVAGTGYKICNDCKQSCIYQTTQAVDTPKVETTILMQLLNLPMGFEIYSLLTRWNPLRRYRIYDKPNTGYKVAVAGLGPAGYSLAYQLAAEGNLVAGLEALKLEEVEPKLINDNGNINPIVDINSIFTSLEERNIYGFGGVSEYGITNRWNKNLLLVIQIILLRHPNINFYGSCALGMNISLKGIQELGFHHLALCMGSGKPTIPSMKNILAKGVKTASDFLMSLQMGAFKLDNLLNLEIKLPLVIIGGGLTSIDCATEALIMYYRLICKINNYVDYLLSNKYSSYHDLAADLNAEHSKTLDEYMSHYKFIMTEKQKCIDSNQKFQLAKTLQKLGGVTIICRKPINRTRAYIENHEELQNALDQGINIIDNAHIHQINVDKNDNVCSIDILQNNKKHNLVVKNLILALGTKANDIFIKKNPILLNNKLDIDSKVIINKLENNFYVSHFGDMNNEFNGSVVKAMSSTLKHFNEVMNVLPLHASSPNADNYKQFFEILSNNLNSYVEEVSSITENIYKIKIFSPRSAKEYKAGQFFKLQTFYSNANIYKNQWKLYNEPLAITGIVLKQDIDYITLLVMNSGASSKMIKLMKPKDKVALMGPCGTASHIPKNKNILLVAGSVGNAIFISIALAMKANNNNVIIVSGYKDYQDIIKLSHIPERFNQEIITYENTPIEGQQPIDYKYCIKGNIIDGLNFFKNNNKFDFAFSDIEYIFCCGSNSMINASKEYFTNNLNHKPPIITNINAIMNCMLEGVCGSCISFDPIKNKYFYACSKQECNIQNIDFKISDNRIKQNSLTEDITRIITYDL